MKRFAINALLLLALASLTLAAAAPVQHEVVVPFSFEKWVDGIIANPNGTNLTPEQAIEAWKRNMKRSDISIPTAQGSAFHDKASCSQYVDDDAYVPAAVELVNWLAAKGDKECMCRGRTTFARKRRAAISCKSSNPDLGVATTCHEIARAVGSIMDRCTRFQRVQGSLVVDGTHGSHGSINVWLKSKPIESE
ncbi:hypothetical protein GQ607_008007 [Colletotrichum asianum]|uniref:SCP domain-containing protein n=1 Tax=Colletotrichum asianum TaxID=702518 RepID=A0A8H3ZSP0_9PEZI|nr:hypothetical protein GQ607_008007 [Colletotrichum asianum]